MLNVQQELPESLVNIENTMNQVKMAISNLKHQYARAEAVNSIWQQNQIDCLQEHLESLFPVDYEQSIDQIARQIADLIRQERQRFHSSLEALQNANEDIRIGRFFNQFKLQLDKYSIHS